MKVLGNKFYKNDRVVLQILQMSENGASSASYVEEEEVEEEEDLLDDLVRPIGARPRGGLGTVDALADLTLHEVGLAQRYSEIRSSYDVITSA